MSTSLPELLPILYRDFYDLPRLILAQYGDGLTVLAVSDFDEVTDEYPDWYKVYRMPVGFAAPDGSWENIQDQASEYLGSVLLRLEDFDHSRRRFLRAAALRPLLGSQGS